MRKYRPAAVCVALLAGGSVFGQTSITPASHEVGAGEVPYQILVNSDAEWTATKDAGWVTLSRTGGLGDMNMLVTAAANATGTERSATIQVNGTATQRVGPKLIATNVQKISAGAFHSLVAASGEIQEPVLGITDQPTNQTVTTGSSSSFMVGVTGTAPLTYRGQSSAPGSPGWTDLANGSTYSGVASATLTITGATNALLNVSCRCVVSNTGGFVCSESAVLMVNTPATPPTITTHPVNMEIEWGQNATFTVGVSGTAPFTYYWQVSAPGTDSWSDLTNNATYNGVNTAALTVTRPGTGLDGNSYRCQVFNSAGWAVSNGAVLTVHPRVTPPSITLNPDSRTITAGQSTTFTVWVSGTAPFTYYWQVSTPGSGGWSDLTNSATYSGVNTATLANSSTLTITGATAGLNGNSYRCQVFNSAGWAVSNGAVLTVNTPDTPPTISTHPANKTVVAGGSTSFTVTAGGSPTLLYYWQVSAPGSTSWTDLANSGVYSGVDTATLAITGATAGLNGNVCRCVIFNPAGYAVSEWARLTVTTPVVAPTVSTAPTNKTVVAGGSTDFTVDMSGSAPLLYYWQVSTPGSTSWTDLANSGVYSGVDTATLAITGATAGLNGNVYRCVIFNPAGYAVSEWARLTVNSPVTAPSVTGQPGPATVAAGATASFTVGVSGSAPLLYYWQGSTPGSTSWTDLANSGVYSGVDTATLAITGATAGLNGNVYRCVIFNSAGHTVSDWARLIVSSPPTISTQPVNRLVLAGTDTSFTVDVSGTAPLAYYWQVSVPGSTSWTDLSDTGIYSGTHTGTLTITGATTGMNGNHYRCQIFNSDGFAVSDSGVLTVGSSMSSSLQAAHEAEADQPEILWSRPGASVSRLLDGMKEAEMMLNFLPGDTPLVMLTSRWQQLIPAGFDVTAPKVSLYEQYQTWEVALRAALTEESMLEIPASGYPWRLALVFDADEDAVPDLLFEDPIMQRYRLVILQVEPG